MPLFDRARVVWLVVGLGLLLGGCSVKRVSSHDPAAQPPAKPYDFEGEGHSPPPPAGTSSPAGQQSPPPDLDTSQPANLSTPAVEVQDLPPAAASAPATPAPGTAPAGVPAAATGSPARFRVQVFASPDAAAAERVRAEVAARFAVSTAVVFEAPFYKVRAGDCPTNDACRALQEELRGAGYETVWIVPDAAR